MRIDHLVVAVRDLDTAMDACKALGFAVEKGGSHPGFGSHNAIIRFGLDYIELLAIENEAIARTAAPGSLAIVKYLEQNEWGMLGFMTAAADLDNCHERLNELGVQTPPPWGMSRTRPDGRELAWKMLLPGGGSWRKAWPTVIDWATADHERIHWDGLGEHPNGARALSNIRIGASDSKQSLAIMEQAFGLQAEPVRAMDDLDAHGVRFWLDTGSVDIVVANAGGNSPLDHIIETQGEGVFDATIGVESIDATAKWFCSRGIATRQNADKSIALQTGALLDGLIFAEISH
jgi:hypothetical protein